MLKQLVYRSHSTGHVDETGLRKITCDSLPFNERHNITGILLFDGEYFFQVLEGESEDVNFLFEHIKKDNRHENVVKVTEIVVHKRDFGDWHLRALSVVEGSSCYWLPPEITLDRESRIFALLNSFASGKWRTCLTDEARKNLRVNLVTPEKNTAPYINSHIQFAFQPIVDTSRGKVSSIEALIRSEDGKYPEDIMGCLKGAEKYEFDLETKAIAIKQGAALISSEQSLSINLCPGAITHRANVGEYLHSLAISSGLKPRQLVLEVTEVEIISESDAFHKAIEQIRSFGIRIAIDDFGAGYAGLSLLADFSPDKIKLDKKITTGIHESGHRQAITEAVLEFANSMGIPLVVEGVETLDEWLWLQHAGVQRFQGYLFARPKLNGVSGVEFSV
ncbi:hypothetical protein BM527_00755 [Alteromonas sp. Mex14]|nr:hypothetical protein BM527_00755 [Alteromonas sp. Mex14]